jgi:hypothetical protein
MLVTQVGSNAFKLRLEQFPENLRKKLVQHMTSVVARLQNAVKEAAPYDSSPRGGRPSHLRDDIAKRVYGDQSTAVVGRVSVFPPIPDPRNLYAKAGALEYGQRRIRTASGLLRRLSDKERKTRRRLEGVVRVSEGLRYLRDPFAEMGPEINAELEAAVAEATAEANK